MIYAIIWSKRLQAITTQKSDCNVYILYTESLRISKKISKLSFLSFLLSFRVLRMIVNFINFLRLIVKYHPILMLNAVEPFSTFVRNSSGEKSQNSIILKIECKLFARVTEEVLTIHELHSRFMSCDTPVHLRPFSPHISRGRCNHCAIT